MSKTTTPTMRDVARLAEVSVATVSAVINGTSAVSAKRAERVRNAMENLDYHPDQIARSLKTGRTQVVGMVVPDVTNPFYPEVIVGAEEAARAARFSLILCNANEDFAQEHQQLSTLFSQRVDGVLIACSDPTISFDRFIRRRFPIVCFDRIPPGFQHDTASVDNFAGAHEATRHLIELGHKRIGLLTGRTSLSTHGGRVKGYREAMLKAQLPVLEEHWNDKILNADVGYELGLKLLSLPSPPTAVFCTNSKLLLGFLRAMKKLGIRCPEDVSVVSFDDFAWTESFNPPITAVAQPARELGRLAMQLLLGKIANKGAEAVEARQVVLIPELKIRKSTAALAS